MVFDPENNPEDRETAQEIIRTAERFTTAATEISDDELAESLDDLGQSVWLQIGGPAS